MNIKKGQRLKINHSRKGEFMAIAERDFDTEKEEFYPVVVAGGEHVKGIVPTTDWMEGERVPCRASLCTFEILINQE